MPELCYYTNIMYERKIKTNIKKIIIATIAVIGIFSLSYSVDTNSTVAQAVDNPLISYANESRLSLGQDILLPNQQLTDAAQQKANDILDKQYFEHTRFDGKEPWDFIKEEGYNYRFAGENLAIGYNDYASIHSAWLNSPEHKANILNAKYDEIGIGVAKGVFEGAETIVVVEMFGRD